MNGKINESTFESNKVEDDRDSNGNIISRDFLINKENCQRAKSLSSLVQRQERLDLIHKLKTEQYNKDVIIYNTETAKYAINTKCENRMIYTFNKIRSLTTLLSTVTEINLPFADIKSNLTAEDMGRHNHKGTLHTNKPTITQMKTFIQLRNKITKFTGKKPVYVQLKNVSKNDLIDRCLGCVNVTINDRHFERPVPVGPRELVQP